ncbi:MAG: polyphosphate glucokinase [Anaerolinea sp.]|nr:polyphosphate glucokinase [Anaerolinea sp.]
MTPARGSTRRDPADDNSAVRRRLGIDIGGSAIKAGIVDLDAGSAVVERLEIPTPQPATPPAIAERIGEIARRLRADGPIGITFPAVIRHGIVGSAANVDESWIGTDGDALFEAATGQPVFLMNDADAAGIAEMRFGAGRDRAGTVIMVTFGTGIGSAIFIDGRLVPNTELGHLEIRGRDAEDRAAAIVKTRLRLGWVRWARLADEYLRTVERLFSPDRFIIGGGISHEADKFLPLLTVRAEVVPAAMGNDAGIVGAAVAAEERLG